MLLTGHFYRQKRRGSMHWLADELVRLGWQVRFVTVGYSWLSLLLGDKRLRVLDARPPQGRHPVRPGLETMFAITPVHPINLRSALANWLARPILGLFAACWGRLLKPLVADCDLVVMESGPPVLLARAVRRHTAAPLVYRVNDDVRLLNLHPMIARAESAAAPLFARISLASPFLARRFAGCGTVALDPMGVDKALFSAACADPYQPRRAVEAVCAGTTQFDAQAVATMARARPDWRFHVIGRLAAPVAEPNVVCHGEMPFADLVPFIRHADIGIAPYLNRPGVEYQTHHSNRLLQYAFFKLPVAAPRRMVHPDLPHIFGYDPADPASVAAALEAARTYPDRATIREPDDWSVLARGIASCAAVAPNECCDIEAAANPTPA